jgi:hypothetical protein
MQKYYLHTEAENGAYKDSNNVRYNLQEIAPENIHIPKSRQGEFTLYETLEDYLISAGLVLSGEHEPTFDLAAAKVAKKQELAAARYAAVNGGTTFNGIPIRTDDQTRTELAIARQFAKENPNLTVQWQLGTGNFIALDAATIIAISNVVLAHQQAQFTKQSELTALVDAATTAEELNAVSW